MQRGRRSKWFVECQQTSGNERYNLQIKLKKWPIGQSIPLATIIIKISIIESHKINEHCSGHIPQLRDFFKRMSTYGFARNWIVFVFVCFTLKLHIKTGFISKSFFFFQNNPLNIEYWIFQCDSTLPLKTMTLTTLTLSEVG